MSKCANTTSAWYAGDGVCQCLPAFNNLMLLCVWATCMWKEDCERSAANERASVSGVSRGAQAL